MKESLKKLWLKINNTNQKALQFIIPSREHMLPVQLIFIGRTDSD